MKNTVTRADIDALMSAAEIDVCTKFEKVTVVTVKLPNGFVLVEASGAVSKENYSEEMGRQVCLDRIATKLWELEGYVLSTQLMRAAACEAAAAELKPIPDRERELVDLLTSARAIAERKGEDTAWERFAERLANCGIGAVTPRTFRVLPGDAAIVS